MLELLRFILSSLETFIGTLLLIGVTGEAIARIVRAARRTSDNQFG